MTLTTTLEAPVTAPSKACLCGCKRLIGASSGRGRPSLYATVQCRRSVEMRARKARVDRPVKHDDPQAQRATLNVRIADPLKMATAWFAYRYPESYRPSGDGRDPSGYRTILASGDYPGTIRGIQDGFTVRVIRGSDVEVTELARWIRQLPRYQQVDLGCRAIEARLSRPLLEESPDKRVSHDALDHRPDPVTLRELRDYYRPDECLLPGCHHPAHGIGLCRSHYDQRRNGTLAA